MKRYDKIPSVDSRGNVIMSLLQKEVILKGLKGQTTVTALFDSGASYSCILRAAAEKVGTLQLLEEPLEFETADAGGIITAEYGIRLSFYFTDTDRRFTDEFFVFDTLSEDLIIGASTMQKWGIRLDFEKEEVLYGRKMHRLRI
jgi:hypothetical protein